MQGYAGKLDERFERFPDQKEFGRKLYSYADPRSQQPWVRSIIVCTRRYGKYRVPQNLKGLIGKLYLFDGRRDTKTKEFQSSVQFEEYLISLGLRVLSDRDYGNTALRWAAMQAGLGIIRKNNFLYSRNGSWLHLEAWMTDQPLELRDQPNLPECPEGCVRCIESCPTQSLAAPYAMQRSTCISCLTTKVLPWSEPAANLLTGKMGSWIYGCDACQDSCPINWAAWEEEEDFPGLSELAEDISLEKIVAMDYEMLMEKIQPKFWYLGQDDLWKWKVNALGAMRNNYRESYRPVIESALQDNYEQVRQTANWVLSQLPE